MPMSQQNVAIFADITVNKIVVSQQFFMLFQNMALKINLGDD